MNAAIQDFDASLLRAGDVLLYSGRGVFSTIIKIKTWSRYSHVEIYDGGRTSLASRDGIGVGRYLLRVNGLALVLRPTCALNLEAGRAWFRTVDGQGYDWVGLMSFTWAEWQGRKNLKQFCSEFACRQLREFGCNPFGDADADAIAPSDFAKNSGFSVVWSVRAAAVKGSKAA